MIITLKIHYSYASEMERSPLLLTIQYFDHKTSSQATLSKTSKVKKYLEFVKKTPPLAMPQKVMNVCGTAKLQLKRPGVGHVSNWTENRRKRSFLDALYLYLGSTLGKTSSGF